MANTTLHRYSVGDCTEVVVEHAGPASYTTDGETISAASLGLKTIHSIHSSGSDDGEYITSTVKGTAGLKATSVKLIWMVTDTGAQTAGAVDLSARKVVLRALGW